MRSLRFFIIILSFTFSYKSQAEEKGLPNLDEVDRETENDSANTPGPDHDDIPLPEPHRTPSEPDPGTEEGAPTTPLPPQAESPDDFVPGRFYYGSEKLVQYRAGNLPIIIVAPHGGRLKPTEIPDRTAGVLTTDLNTYEAASALYYAINRSTGRFPHFVSCKIARIKLDCNRALEEASEGDAKAIQAWHDFHGFIMAARKTVVRDFGKGLYIDLHGHGHTIPRLELGYQLSKDHLRVSDMELDSAAYIERSTIREIALRTGIPFSKIIRGPQSFGSALEALGIAAVPSMQQPDSGDEALFNGGYNVVRYGSRDGGTISAIQIESHMIGIRDTMNHRRAFAEKLDKVLRGYLKTFFNIAL